MPQTCNLLIWNWESWQVWNPALRSLHKKDHPRFKDLLDDWKLHTCTSGSVLHVLVYTCNFRIKATSRVLKQLWPWLCMYGCYLFWCSTLPWSLVCVIRPSCLSSDLSHIHQVFGEVCGMLVTHMRYVGKYAVCWSHTWCMLGSMRYAVTYMRYVGKYALFWSHMWGMLGSMRNVSHICEVPVC